MNRWILFSMVSLVLVHNSARAAVLEIDWKNPGDGLLTFDTISRRAWLDLTPSRIYKFPGSTFEERYQNLVAELAPGGMFSDFSWATRDDLFAFAESAGIDTTIPIGDNREAADALTSLLGYITVGAGSSTPSKWSQGFLSDGSFWMVQLTFDNREGNRFGLGSGGFYDAGSLWLYRQIPEPASLLLGLLTFGTLVCYRQRIRGS